MTLAQQQQINQTRTHLSQRFKSKPRTKTICRSGFMHVESEDLGSATHAFKHANLRHHTQIDNKHSCIKLAKHKCNLNRALASARGSTCASKNKMMIATPQRKPTREDPLQTRRCLANRIYIMCARPSARARTLFTRQHASAQIQPYYQGVYLKSGCEQVLELFHCNQLRRLNAAKML